MSIELTCTLFSIAHINDAIKCLSAATVENEDIDMCIKILRRVKDEYMERARKLMAQEESE